MKYLETWNFPGKTNMALDTVLGEHSAKVREPILRIYSWERPTLSIGRHQRAFESPFECVRRPTGGRAVLHWKEITYSVVFPKGSEEFKLSVLQLYRKISEIFLKAFRDLGLDVKMSKGWGSLKSESCFSSSARYELTLNGKKFLGSAQMRTSSYVLQHGSIILEYPRDLLKFLGWKDEKAIGILEVQKVGIRRIVDSILRSFDEVYGLDWMDFETIMDLLEEAKKREGEFSCRNSTSYRHR